VIAEKPSVARDIARALGRRGEKLKTAGGLIAGERHVVTWAIGHLLELCEPEDYRPDWKRWRLEHLPIIPPAFRLRPLARTKQQLDTVTALLRSAAFSAAVNACDAGREGELIFRHLMEASGSNLPVRRLWVSAMTDEAIVEGLGALRDGRELESLEAAARCRSESDWLVGINATRGMTRKCGVLLSVGRVQTPTLAILAEREREIQAFVPRRYWEVHAKFRLADASEPATYEGIWYGPGSEDGRLDDPDRALAIAAKVSGREGVVEEVESRRKSQPPPLLYDLTQLQREMNRRHGFSASRTLSLAQDLYEKYKVITYPRTDSRFLSGKAVPLIAPALRAAAEASAALAGLIEPLLEAGRPPITARIVNDARVRDHHAIIPTPRAASAARLKGDHLKVFDAVARRLVAVFYPPAVYEDTTVRTVVEEEAFRSRGRVIVQRGWLAVEDVPWLTRQAASDPGEEEAGGGALPALKRGDRAAVTAADALRKETKPPPRYTEAALLQAMETSGKLLEDEELQEAMKDRGIGTPATRAAIIERLIDVGYVERQRRTLHPTPKGLELIAAIPTRDLVSASLTGLWEAKLREVERGTLAREAFMADIKTFVEVVVSDIARMDTEGLAGRMRRTVGPCPKCGAEVVEGRKAYSCSRWKEKGCDFYVWKVIAGRPIRPAEVEKLLKEGRTYLLRGFRSRAGRRFPAYLTLDSGRVKFEFPSKARSGKSTRKAGKSREGQPVATEADG